MNPEVEKANAYRIKQEYDTALRVLNKHLELSPGDPDIFNLRGMVFRDLGGLRDSEEALRKALGIDPLPRYWFNLGITLLQQAKWPEGWKYYESRDLPADPARNAVPLWKGESLKGKRVLVFQEQGLGDLMQFARYIPHLRLRREHVTLHCDEKLRSLLHESAGPLKIDTVISQAEAGEAFDVRVPHMSLPHFLRLYDPLTEQVPYLLVPDDIEPIIAPASEGDSRKRIAIAYSCKRSSENHDARSCPLSAFAPMVAAAGLELFSVQFDPHDAERQQLHELKIHDLSAQLKSLAHTASVLRSVRALLTVDTSVAHLGGALNIETVLMLHTAADWRWHDDRERSRWYKSVRIVRQSRPWRWDDVIARAHELLRGL